MRAVPVPSFVSVVVLAIVAGAACLPAAAPGNGGGGMGGNFLELTVVDVTRAN